MTTEERLAFLTLLEAIEWSKVGELRHWNGSTLHEMVCPICDETEERGHLVRCALLKCLRVLSRTEPAEEK